ncbi:MAG: hypothetical protein D8M52_09295 [Chlorobi bacterium]|nr:MAG: hypothetical protein F9K28_04800 [Bacteroidota bacterium]KXK32427.1 MAG: hypothetical protein UZ06_CHB003002057 [Chlorobi bacterium OLB6]MBE2266530.1 hypothetical protein [Flavobacteriales bacterium]MBL1161897.1 hypothetical protein [Chlorobiota bacterium]MBW7852682.1 hypothetical protein [Candidatus Kapabacteria bacterium]MCC6331058.1 hypothetical protein [Ignavibacteria bacterium]
MSVSSRTKLVELSEHTLAQQITFYMLVVLCTATLLLAVAVPILNSFFEGFLRNEVVRDGTEVLYRMADNRADEIVTTGGLTTWALIDPKQHETSKPRAEYIFQPLIALAPLVAVGGVVCAALLTIVIPGGFLRQKIQREIVVVLNKLTVKIYGDHSADEIAQVTRDIKQADLRRLHEIADTYQILFSDLNLLRQAILWRDSAGPGQLFKTHDAVKFYMREYFTDQYSNAVLGFVYIGAAVLIIVIGLRGIKFLPATDPSFVLGALGLEFILLITYATVLMYGRADDGQVVPASAPYPGYADAASQHETEQLLRAFLAVQRGDTKE